MRVTQRISSLSATLLLVLSMAVPFLNPLVANAFSGSGASSSASPYVVTTCAQLQSIDQDAQNEATEDKRYELGNDIDCSMTNPDDPDWSDTGTWSDEKGFDPIGDNSHHFNAPQ